VEETGELPKQEANPCDVSGQNSDDVVEGHSNVWQDSFPYGQTTSLPYTLEVTVALIHHVLTSSYFGFDGQLYKQTIWNI
jgi:hypothetical protein